MLLLPALWLLLCCAAGPATAAAAARQQPGALDRYPPTLRGRFEVAVDHFSYVPPARTFFLRYLAYDGFGKSSSGAVPVLLYFGNEDSVEKFYNATGGMFEAAAALRALVVFVEHRYYGQSLPFGTNSSFTPEGIRYLTIEQALADYAEFLGQLSSFIGCHGGSVKAAAARCDVILFGGSYGGMLAVWHRLKYPHLSIGAVASGAPVDFYEGVGIQQQFRAAYLHTFDTYGASPGCASRVTRALKDLQNVTRNDLEAAGFHTCTPVATSGDRDRLQFYVEGVVSKFATVDYPYPATFAAPLPANPVQTVCAKLERAANAGQDSLAVLASIVGMLVNGTGDLTCYNLDLELVGTGAARAIISRASLQGSSIGATAWTYQACTEMPLEPLTSDGYGFFPPADGQQTEQVLRRCRERFHAVARPAWLPRSFGKGADLSRVLTNVFFAENDKDPWHIGTSTVRPNPARGIFRTVAAGGAHHQEFRFSDAADSPGVQRLRQEELAAVQQWLRSEDPSFIV